MGLLILLKLLTLHPDVWTIFRTLVMFVLAVWWVGCDLRGSSMVGLVPLAPEPGFGTCVCWCLVMMFLPGFVVDFDIEFVRFPFLDCDVPRSTPYVVYISQLTHYDRASSHVADFKTRNKLLTQKLLKQGYWDPKILKTFS